MTSVPHPAASHASAPSSTRKSEKKTSVTKLPISVPRKNDTGEWRARVLDMGMSESVTTDIVLSAAFAIASAAFWPASAAMALGGVRAPGRSNGGAQ